MSDPQSTPQPGSVITVRAPNNAELELGLVLSVAEHELDVAAVSEETKLATDRDALLPANVAGFAAAVFPDTHGPILREQYGETLGASSANKGKSVWVATGLSTGPPVLSEADPRIGMRVQLAEQWTPYWEPVASLHATQTFGELLARSRTVSDADARDLTLETGISSGVIEALERDDADAFVAVGPRRLATVLRKLAVILGPEAEARLRVALLPSLPTTGRPSVAYRAGSQNRRSQAARHDADRYVAAVHRFLNE